jgi:acetate kinase
LALAAMSPAIESTGTRTNLALNSGSSSLKFGLYRVGPSETEMLVSGEAEAIGELDAKFHAINAVGDSLLSVTAPIGSQEDVVAYIGKFLADRKFPMAAAVGHRVVHGGPTLSSPISAMAQASPPSEMANRLIPAWG